MLSIIHLQKDSESFICLFIIVTNSEEDFLSFSRIIRVTMKRKLNLFSYSLQNGVGVGLFDFRHSITKS